MECIGYIKELKKFSQSVNSKKNSKNRIAKETWHWQITNHSANHHNTSSPLTTGLWLLSPKKLFQNKIYMIYIVW